MEGTMEDLLKDILERHAQYQRVLDDIQRQFGTEATMFYFSDRFGPDHALSSVADEGIRIHQSLSRMRRRMEQVHDELLAAFPAPSTHDE